MNRLVPTRRQRRLVASLVVVVVVVVVVIVAGRVGRGGRGAPDGMPVDGTCSEWGRGRNDVVAVSDVEDE